MDDRSSDTEFAEAGGVSLDIHVPAGWWLASPERRQELGVQFLAFAPTRADWFESNIVAALDPRPADISTNDLANQYAMRASAGAPAVTVVRRETVGDSLTQLIEFEAIDPDTGAAHQIQQLQTLISIPDTQGGPGATAMVSLTAPPDELQDNARAFEQCVASVSVNSNE